ncbi:CHASE2 domain-containing protein [Pleurocapsales cyanobacterium LEGE 06147]|nr:CHASE2 domain-containing protein [Pleurocapsales cyanobacterium LEGE 06147]
MQKLRRGFGPAADAAAGIPQLLARNPGGVGSLLRRKRAKVAALAVLFGLVSAAIELPLPAEDFYRAVRAEIRSRPAPQDIVMIAIDDKTLNAFDRNNPSRVQDSQLIERLVASGVERITFDRAHADPESSQADALFARTLERHKGRVWLGIAPQREVGFQVVEEIAPRAEFRDKANLAGMSAVGSPFGLSITFHTKVEMDGATHPSLSAALAEYEGPDRTFRPDYAFDPATLPSFSYVDVLNGKVAQSALAGKNVIIGKSYFESSDYYTLPLRDGRIAGAYFHIMGAHTLKRGVPADLQWYPAMLLATIAIFALMLGRTKSTRSLLGVGVGLLFIPLLFDEFGVNIDIMPALLALLWAGIGFKRIARKYYSSEVDAMTTSAISSDKANSESDVYALKIASLSEMSDDWSARELGEFVNTLIAYVKGPGDAGDVAFERDILVWLAPRMTTEELERHADGLALMLKTAISHDWRSASTGPALGIDTNHSLPLGQRIRKAMQAAEEAASRGARFIINDAAHLEARNHRLEILRLLEKGLRDRSITVAYQPKVDLASGRIVGAETLIRWQPDGGDYVNPQELVQAAETGDRINELTLVVMEAALADGKQAIALDPTFKLAVNMSAKSLGSGPIKLLAQEAIG